MKLFGGFYPLFVLEVFIGARVESQTTTTTPAPSGSTCSGATVGCMTAVTGTNTDGCGVMSRRVECFSGTRTSNCSVDESMVTFDNFLPVFSDICNAVVNYSSSCLEFTFCLLDTDYSIMASAVNYTVGPSVPQIANFTSSRFWCTESTYRNSTYRESHSFGRH
ncbi:uncharacterized protein [Littorina saxatilis]|uniref:uncharacterized protein n=1 Tax=Littorina saxatilis TaxID=31220 RepID=UPI0038B535BB